MLNKLIKIVRDGGLPIISLFVFLEGNPIIGTLIPGQFLIIFFGFILSTENNPNLLLIILTIAISSYTGDIIGYYIGKKYGIKGLQKFNINVENQVYKTSKIFFEKYGTFAIILGREFNLTRAFIPFLVGTLDFNLIKFLIVAALSNLIWASVSILLGYYFGTFIITNFKIFLTFVTLIVIYTTMIIITCKTYNHYTKEKKITVEKYAVHHIIHILTTILILSLIAILTKNLMTLNKYLIFLNPIFNFVNSSVVLLYSVPIISMILALLIIGINLFKREIKLLNGFLWGFFFTTFLFLIINRIIKKLVFTKLYFSMTFVIYLLFYFWITFRNILNEEWFNLKKWINYLIVLMIVLIFFIMGAKTGNSALALITLSFSAIITELLLILSKYRILNEKIYQIYINNRSK